VVEDCLKLTTYFDELARGQRRLLADELLDLYAHSDVLASIVLRGVEGFGSRHLLHTERLLTLSHDLPLVTVAVDTHERMTQLLPGVMDLCRTGLVTLERARMIADPSADIALDTSPYEAIKLTLLVGRSERTNGRLAHLAAVDLMHRHGVDGVTAFLGVDGTAHRVRRRAGFFDRNADVPVTVVAISAADTIAAALPELRALLPRALLLIEHVRVCKVAGAVLGRPLELPESDPSGLPLWHKLMVHAPEYARHDGQPVYTQLIRRLREAGAAGATAVRGFWGYQGNQRPHGDALLALRRRVPVMVSVIDTPERSHRWYEIVDDVTTESGLVTSEFVPAARAASSSRDADALRPAIHRR
jgi:PII-like signaling protein